MVSIRRMTAGNGYKYLLKTGVALCHTEKIEPVCHLRLLRPAKVGKCLSAMLY